MGKNKEIEKRQTSINTQNKLIEALEKSLGIASQACKASGISYHKHVHFYRNDPEYRARVDAIKELSLDFAETKLMQAINEVNVTAIIYYLNNKGQTRGYLPPSKQGSETPAQTVIKIVRE